MGIFSKKKSPIKTYDVEPIKGYELINKLKEKIGYKAYIFVILFLVGKNWKILEYYLFNIVAPNYGKYNAFVIEQRYLEEIGSNFRDLEYFDQEFANNKYKYITENELKRLNKNFEEYGKYNLNEDGKMLYVINRKLNRSEFSCVINLNNLYESVKCLLNKNKENNMSNVFNQRPGLLDFYNLKQEEILNLLKQK
jgi:hypothetical protein